MNPAVNVTCDFLEQKRARIGAGRRNEAYLFSGTLKQVIMLLVTKQHRQHFHPGKVVFTLIFPKFSGE